MPESELMHALLRPSGDRVLIPPIGDTGARLVLRGAFTFRYDSSQFDACYRTGADGAFSQRHSLFQWTPRTPLLESADVAGHRYQLRVPAEWKLGGQSIGLRLDLDRLVDEYLIPPSDVRAALTGEMELLVLPVPAAPVSLWPTVVRTSVPVALLAGGFGWILRRRMDLASLPVELQLQMDRIVRKQRAAIAALEAGPRRYHGLGDTVKEAHDSAWRLARRIGSLRDARSRLDGMALAGEVKRLEQELAYIADPVSRGVGQSALVEKRKVLTMLEQIERREVQCALRLSTLEATLDTACLTFGQLQPDGPVAPTIDTLRRELEAEVGAIAEEEISDREARWM